MRDIASELLINNDRLVYELLQDMDSKSYIDPMGFTAKKIEQFCASNTLDVSRRANNEEVEHRRQPPMMAPAFYYYLYTEQKLPSQQEFQDFYYQINPKWIEEKIPEELNEAFLGRLARFYASIMRDIHFYHLAKESPYFDAVKFSLRHDIRHKIDLWVEKNGQAYGLQLRVKTKNSDSFYQQKPNRGAIDSGAILIDVPLDLNLCKRIPTKKDDFKFYSFKHVDEVIHYIEDKSNR